MAIPEFRVVNTKFVMAASISQTRYDYKINLQQAIKEGKIVPVAVEKCPLCKENRTSLLCDSCINSGSFTHSQRRDCGRFDEKKDEWVEKKKQRHNVCRRFELEIDDIERANIKRSVIEMTKRKIALLKKAITETKIKCDAEKTELLKKKKSRRQARHVLENNQQVSLRNVRQKIVNLTDQPAHLTPPVDNVLDVKFDRDCNVAQLFNKASSLMRHSKVSKDGTCIDSKSVPILRQELEFYHHYLARRRLEFVTLLSQRIFPIQEIYAISEPDSLQMSTVTALKDACETAFIGGRWVHTDHRGENHCKIVDSTLPDYYGDMAALHLFGIANRHASENPDKVPVGNPSYGIYSALGYTAMFISLAAYVLDIHLPRKCSHRELRDDMTEADFANFVWRLHQNILHLACSQFVEPDHLLEHPSLQNVISLLRCPYLGRTGAFEANYHSPVLADLCTVEYEDENDVSTGDMDLSREWERVPSGLPTVENSQGAMGVSEPTDNNASTAGAFISTAAASLAGWWRSYYN